MSLSSSLLRRWRLTVVFLIVLMLHCFYSSPHKQSQIISPTNTTALEYKKNQTAGEYPQSLLNKFNQSMAIEPIYHKIENSKDSGFTVMNCAAGGRYPFKMHSGGICVHVCQSTGEKRVAAVMQKVFEKGCHDKKLNLMLDVGSNHGYFGLLAMKMGCESLLFDLQPECHQMINNAIVVNNFTNIGRVIPSGVSNSVGELKVSNSGCIGTFPVSAHRQGALDKGDVVVPIAPLNHFIHGNQPVLMMKVDTEGNEQRVLEGAMPFFQKHLIHNAIVEVTSGNGFWKLAGVTKEQVAVTFATISSYGYTMVSLGDYQVLRTEFDVASYINKEATFTKGQYDMWIVLGNMSETDVEDIKIFG